MSTDPFDDLATPLESQDPRPSFARDLRRRLRSELGLDDEPPTISLPERKRAMTTTTTTGGDPDHGRDVPGLTPGETIPAADRPGTGGGIWAGAFYSDALAGIRFLVDVIGFEEQLVVVAEDGTTVVHSQLRWPEGGIVQAGTYDPSNVFTQAPGEQSLYVVTADPDSIWQRCSDAGVEVIREPEEPDHAPGTMSFAIRDPEGNIWSFGQYGMGV